MSAILSIVIPTRNRINYVKSAIKSVLSINEERLELVIQDSSDDQILGAWIQTFIDDCRLIYNYSRPPYSMTENFNKAVDLASGEYVCIIGDDDGVNPEIIDAAYWAETNAIDALTPGLGGASYYWPDFCSRDFGAKHSGQFFVNRFTGNISFPDVESEMQKCVRYAGQEKFGLPKIYFGLVRRSCLSKVNEEIGTYFKGVSPDMFGALSIANHAKRICAIDYPLVLPGSSGGSNSGRSALGTHKGRLADDPHMVGYDISQWPECVPGFFSVETVWAGAAVEALCAIGRNDLLRQFNWSLLYALCNVNHKEYYSTTMRSFNYCVHYYDKSYAKARVELIRSMGMAMVKRLIRFAYRAFMPDRGIREITFDNVDDIEAAACALTKHLRKTGMSFEKLVAER